MLRGFSISAALAALAVPLLLAGPSHADPGGTPSGTTSEDPAASSQARKAQRVGPSRKQVVSRRANRARAQDDAPLGITIEQLTPS